MKSSSLKMALQHGIAEPAKYRDSLIHDWYLPKEYKRYLHIHFLAKEESQILKAHVREGILQIGGIDYQVTWIHKPATVYESYLALLSFRYCKYLKTGYVLIKELEEKQTINFKWVEYDKGIIS